MTIHTYDIMWESPFKKLLKYGLIEKILTQYKVPDRWKTSTIILTFKKGDKQAPTNYKNINLLDTTWKLVTKVIICIRVPMSYRIVCVWSSISENIASLWLEELKSDFLTKMYVMRSLVHCVLFVHQMLQQKKLYSIIKMISEYKISKKDFN